jgi:hypothetical protein
MTTLHDSLINYISSADLLASGGVFAFVTYLVSRLHNLNERLIQIENNSKIQTKNKSSFNKISQILIVFLATILFLCIGYFLNAVSKDQLLDISHFIDDISLITLFASPFIFNVMFKIKNFILTYISFSFLIIMFISYNIFKIDYLNQPLANIGWDISIVFTVLVMFLNSITDL